MLLFAALTFVSLVERGVPFAAAFAISLAVMIALGIGDRAIGVAAAWSTSRRSRCSWRRSGLSYVIEGAAQLLWGTQVHGLDLGIDDTPLEVSGVLVSTFDLFAAGVAAADGRSA